MRPSLATLVVLATLPLAAFGAHSQTVALDVQNMTCAVCPITVKKSLLGVAGVSDVRIDFVNKTAHVDFDPDRIKPADLTTATTNAGFPSTVQK